MKKLLSLALATVMALSLTTVAFADESASTNDVSSVTVTKTLTATGLEDETFSFVVDCTEVANVASGVDTETYDITGFPITVKAGDTTGSYTISLPNYTSVGVYTYEIVETPGLTAGVTYTTTAMYLVVTVTNGEDGSFIRSVAIHTGSATGPKVDAGEEGESGSTGAVVNFTNTYEAGSLAVTKSVTGNLGDKSKVFTATVTFTSSKPVNSVISYTDDGETKTIETSAWTKAEGSSVWTATATITVKDAETVTFTNIPAGVTYVVTEDDYSKDGYTTSYTYGDETKTISSTESDTVTITNNKNQNVDTGINLDTLPYVMMLAVVAAAAIALLMKKRNID